ncbi:hypothetical protein GGD67_002291 [Bradyrhizobium sp. IAR9]|nr:hypothetical protein [Bradyrhizobium sp. IAR9]NYG44843.1 hypothetical protein [Bradyrhizobium sp. IAR9]
MPALRIFCGERADRFWPAKDEIIEPGMVKFDYTPDGQVAGV